MMKFHSLVNEVRRGKTPSVFSQRTEDSSAIQYFQVCYALKYHITSPSKMAIYVCKMRDYIGINGLFSMYPSFLSIIV